MKNNLFISSNALTTIISSLIIEEKHKDDNNILLIVANHLETKFLDSMVDTANALGCFNKILLFNNYSESMKLNCTVTLKDAKTFNFNDFENDTKVNNFDKIYTTFMYFQSRTIISHYTNAKVSAIENGTASYLPQNLEKELAEKITEFYSFNYFNLLQPMILKNNKSIQNIQIDKEKIKDKFKKLSNLIQLEKSDNAIIFCAHNLALNRNLISEKYEFEEYSRIIKELIKQGYTVYFKEHPKTPAYFYDKLRTAKYGGKIKLLREPYPVEMIVPKLNPKGIVSVFSSSLLTVKHIFDIPTYTFTFKNNFTTFPSYEMAYAMIMAYIPKIDNDAPAFNIKLDENPLPNVIFTEALKMFVDKKTFMKIQKNIKNVDYKHFEYFNISKELYDIYSFGSYWHLLIHYTEPYAMQIKQSFKSSTKKEFFIKTLKIIKKMF